MSNVEAIFEGLAGRMAEIEAAVRCFSEYAKLAQHTAARSSLGGLVAENAVKLANEMEAALCVTKRQLLRYDPRPETPPG